MATKQLNKTAAQINDFFTDFIGSIPEIVLFTGFKQAEIGYLYLSASRDLVNFNMSNAVYKTDRTTLRDPSIAKIGDSYYILHTNGSLTGNISLIKTNDFVNYVRLGEINMGFGSYNCYAPEWVKNIDNSIYLDENNFPHFQFSSNVSGTYKLYDVSANNELLSNTSWDEPVLILGIDNAIDPSCVKIGNTFNLFYTDISEGNSYISLATGSAVDGTFTPIKTGDWAGFGNSMEGQSIIRVKQSDTTYRYFIFFDSVPTSETGTFMSYTDDATLLSGWSVPVNVLPGFNHCTAIVLKLSDDLFTGVFLKNIDSDSYALLQNGILTKGKLINAGVKDNRDVLEIRNGDVPQEIRMFNGANTIYEYAKIGFDDSGNMILGRYNNGALGGVGKDIYIIASGNFKTVFKSNGNDNLEVRGDGVYTKALNVIPSTVVTTIFQNQAVNGNTQVQLKSYGNITRLVIGANYNNSGYIGTIDNFIFNILVNNQVAASVGTDKTFDSIGGFKVNGTAGVDGTFTTADGKTVTVTKGLITSIV